MSYWRFSALANAALLCIASAGFAANAQSAFTFGVIGQVIATPGDAAPLAQAIAESDADNLAFVVADGFKRADEACSDELYEARRELLSGAKNGIMLTLAAGDWSDCKNASGHSTAIERLSRARELFYVDEFSLGASRIPLIRQSNAAKFRSYVENARWEVGSTLFVSINLPAPNNRYRMEAGRNSEFEDRLIANHEWLQHSFAIAARKKMSNLILLCDGNPLQKPGTQRLFESNTRRDGFAEVRQQLTTLAAKFPGKVLIVHNHIETHETMANDVSWHGNIGEVDVGTGWLRISVDSTKSKPFAMSKGGSESRPTNQ